jgi:A/G-specific adenine glycosylase
VNERNSFAARLLRWHRRHGRHDLPWQHERNLYRVWIAEIMLQQTQVGTVIPYYQRFMSAFPDQKALSAAPLERVLECWSGLGYYSRARNLHRAAQLIATEHGGNFPRDYENVLSLPGIGRSTAGAILAQALGQRHAILDGNVKRVLARYHAVEGWSGNSSVLEQLWRYAEQHTPEHSLVDYTQAIMDLGATVCTRSRPACETCPLNPDCIAFNTDRVGQLPAPRPKKSLPVKSARLLVLTNEHGAILLEKRPPSGIWGGLWSLPETAPDEAVESVCRARWGLRVLGYEDGACFRHSFSHYHLDITPCRVRVRERSDRVNDAGQLIWCRFDDATLPAMATPVAKIVRQYTIT